MGAVADQIKPGERAFQMQSRIPLSAILVLAMLASAGHGLAQTGEFANQPPGSVVHQGYALQDWWQSQRNGAREQAPPAETMQAPVVLWPSQPDSSLAKPRSVKTSKKVTANSHVQPKQPQPQ
jgi:hypothetical protein